MSNRSVVEMCASFKSETATKQLEIRSFLESCVPTDEVTWMAVDQFFREQNASGWAEIMMDRFQPFSANSSQFEIATLESFLSRTRLQSEKQRDELYRRIKAILRRRLTQPVDLLRLIALMNQARDYPSALEVARNGCSQYPDNLKIWRQAVLLSARAEGFKRARLEFAKMKSAVADHPRSLLFVSEVAAALNDPELLRGSLTDILNLSESKRRDLVVPLIGMASQAGMIDLIRNAATCLRPEHILMPGVAKTLIDVGRRCDIETRRQLEEAVGSPLLLVW